MTIEESCKNIIADVGKLEDHDVVEDSVRRLEEHRQKLAHLRSTLEEVVEKIKILGETYCTLPHAGSAAHDLAKYSQNIESDESELRKDFTVVRKSIDDTVGKAKENLECGICGEHGGDPQSIAFCHALKLNYVSCSPFRIPIARLAAAQAALRDGS